MSENHIMLDLETLGTGPTSAIVSIGAKRICSNDSFYAVVDPHTCLSVGMTADTETMIWWMQQNEDSRQVFVAQDAMPIQSALHLFAKWVGRKAFVWGNGSDFDNTILASAYRSCDTKLPWRWSQNRCYRTIKNLCPKIEIPRTGTHHNALDDATSQAGHLMMCLEELGVDLNNMDRRSVCDTMPSVPGGVAELAKNGDVK